MIRRSDRLRVLCFVIGLTVDDLGDRLAGPTAAPDAKARARDQAALWLSHTHQPKRERSKTRLISVLQAAANERHVDIDVGEIFDGNYTASALAEACGKPLHIVVPQLSDEAVLEAFEECDRHPPLRHLRNLASSARFQPDHVIGSYLLYRVHSTDRVLCRETLHIAPSTAGYFLTGTYRQYTQGGHQRELALSVFALGDYVHAIGAHPDSRANGSTAIVHGIAMRTAHRLTFMPGMVLGTMDTGGHTMAQRILLRKISRRPDRLQLPVKVILKPPLDREHHSSAAKYLEFLRSFRDEDEYMMMADVTRLRHIDRRPHA